MSRYAFLKDGVFDKFYESETLPEVATHKGYSVLPVEEEVVNTATQQYVDVTTEAIIEQTRYLLRTTIADKPPAEITAIEEAEKDDTITSFNADRSLPRALALTLFDAVNEIRTLKAQAPLTLDQFKSYVRGKL